MRNRTILLVGPMGVGKTTIGKKLAKRLELPFIDTDQRIVSEHGEISEIFENQGEKEFRRIEEEVLSEVVKESAVISTGGGAVLSQRNQDLMKQATVVYLATDGKHIASRLSKGKRPLLKNGFSDWKEIYAARKPIYLEVATIVVDTSKQGLRATIEEICEKLERL
ncbi:MAG: shikimate kinase [Micrococcales bacterium]|nr:shikimate kinase [Micrococcales bacterium]